MPCSYLTRLLLFTISSYLFSLSKKLGITCGLSENRESDYNKTSYVNIESYPTVLQVPRSALEVREMVYLHLSLRKTYHQLHPSKIILPTKWALQSEADNFIFKKICDEHAPIFIAKPRGRDFEHGLRMDAMLGLLFALDMGCKFDGEFIGY